MNHTETSVAAAERILSTVLNGNRGDARTELQAMTGGRAAAVAGYMIDQAPEGYRSSVLRLLESAGDEDGL